MYFIVCSAFVSGGLKTLALTQAKLLRRKNKEVCFIGSYLDEETLKICNQQRIKTIVLKKWNQSTIKKTIKGFAKNKDHIQFLEFRDFLPFQLVNKRSYNCYYYCVDPWGMCIFNHINLPKGIIKLFNKHLARIISAYTKNGNIIYMDDNCLKNNLSYYGIDANIEHTTIPLPFHSLNNNLVKKDYNHINLLAIARADFPFKGYLIGLLKQLDDHISELPSFSITIISIGKDIDELKKAINSVCKQLKNRIELIEGLPNFELKQYYSNAYLYIGMGTTVLEAANYYTPTIVVKHDTYDFISQGFFHANPYNVGSNIFNGHEGIEDVKYLLHLSKKEYNEVQIQTKNSLNYYDDTKIVNQIVNLSCDYKYRFSFIQRLLLNTYFFTKKVIYKSF